MTTLMWVGINSGPEEIQLQLSVEFYMLYNVYTYTIYFSESVKASIVAYIKITSTSQKVCS